MSAHLLVLTGAMLLLIPGPTNTLLAAAGTLNGFRRSLHLLFAELFGYSVSVFTISSLLTAWAVGVPAIAQVLRALSGTYLLILAAYSWSVNRDHTAPSPTFARILITTILNPKALIFASIVSSMEPSTDKASALILLFVIPLVGSGWISFGAFAGWLILKRYTRFVPRFTSIILAAFGVALLIKVVAY